LTGLAAIILAQSIDSIGEYAFADCSAVTAFRLPQWNAPVREVCIFSMRNNPLFHNFRSSDRRLLFHFFFGEFLGKPSFSVPS
jgi:hypothetical protein